MQMMTMEDQLGTTGGLSTSCGIGVGMVVGIAFIPGGLFALMSMSEMVAMGLIAACA